MSRGALFAIVTCAMLSWLPVSAQSVGGVVFEDRDADGIQDAGEPAMAGVDVRLFGRTDSAAAVDQTTPTGVDGVFGFTPGDGCYLVAPSDPPGWRASLTRADRFLQSTPGYQMPVGLSRFSKLDQAIGNLEAGPYRIAAMGDSIAANFNVLCGGISFWYNKQLQSRLQCVSGSNPTLDEAAVLGEHTDDFLVLDGDLNNVFATIQNQPQLVTISIIGNDLLDVDPGDGGSPADHDRAVREVLDARQNLQESLSSLVSEIPDADVVLNTLYDNEADDCSPTNFHKSWVPIVARVLRDVAWGQSRRVAIAEVAADFAQLGQDDACTGFDDLICTFFLDRIHPTQSEGYPVVAEKLWESAGGVRLGSSDALGRTSHDAVDYGYLRLVRRLYPTQWVARNGASVVDPQAALQEQDDADASITLGAGNEEVRFYGFPDWYDEIQIVRTNVGVRYRTGGFVDDEPYRIEASTDAQFRPPPGWIFTPTNWNFYTPIVGGGGPLQPPENPDYAAARTLVVPNVSEHRIVQASLTTNPVLLPGAAEYGWPALTHEQLGTSQLRVAAAPDPGAAGDDSYTIELDAAWIDLYGWEKPRPGEVVELRVARAVDGSLELSFDELTSATRYNAYAGRLSSLPSGYDHGSLAPVAPLCDAPTSAAAAGRRQLTVAASGVPSGSSYFLVTAHVDDVESPAGFATPATEIDRSQSICD